MKYSTLLNNTILSIYRGSTAHGMLTNESDIDIINVCVAPTKYHLGLHHFEAKKQMTGYTDIDFYEIKKMFKMLLATNPNVFPYIYNQEKHILQVDESGQLILDNKDLFKSSKVASTFAGYARGELQRVDKRNGRMDSKRKALFDKYGYDCKSASNCIRIARMGLEFLETGEIQPDRTNIDAQELLDIKINKYNIQDIKMEGLRLIEKIKQAKKKTSLPEEPDMDRAEELLIEIIESHWKRKER